MQLTRAQQPSFDHLVAVSHRRLLRQLTAMTADLEQAQDCLQEAYERAWARWPTVSRLEDPEAWIRKVAWRVAVSSHRRRTTFARLLPRLLPAASRAPSPSGGPTRASSSAAGGGAEEAMDVQEALRRLTPDQRRALVLHYFIGMSVAEVAVETGASVGSVKSRLHRGRLALATLLGPAYPDDGPDEVLQTDGRWSS
jgi:RNA polymerase sigma-70 factor (ECF subfamily)